MTRPLRALKGGARAVAAADDEACDRCFQAPARTAAASEVGDQDVSGALALREGTGTVTGEDRPARCAVMV